MANEYNIDLQFWGICYSIQDIPTISLNNICFAERTVPIINDALFTISYKDDFIILSSNEPYQNIQLFTGFSEDITQYAGTFKREFRWGIEDQTWSDWIELSVENLNHYIRYIEYKKIYIEFRYTMLTEGMVTIRSISLDWEEHEDKWKNWRPFPIAYSKEKGNHKYPIRIRPFSYNPYKQNPAIKLQKDLSFMMNNLHGHEVTYFRAIPDKRSQDVIWNEYSISNVESTPKCIKVLVPNNEFPDNKFNFGAFGVDFEIPFEVHIDKRYFEWVFGLNAHPGKRDVIFFEKTDRIYEVVSTQLVRDFMQEPIYYKLSLIKYQPKSSRIESPEVKAKIDEFTTGFNKLFGEDIKAEMEQIVNPQQTVEKSSVYDPIRQWTYPIDFIVQHTIENYGTIIAQYHYDIGYLYDQLKEYTPIIRYKAIANFAPNQNLTYTCWFQEEQKKTTFRPVSSIVSVNGNLITVAFDILPKIQKNQWLGLLSTNNTNFELFGQVQNIQDRPSGRYITFRSPNYILNKMNVIYPTWQQDTGLIGKEIFRRNFLYGYDEFEQLGIRIDSINSKYFRISLNDMRWWFELPNKLLANTWYGMVINIAKLYQEISLHLYTIAPKTSKTTKLVPYFEGFKKDIYDATFQLGSFYEILASNLRLTNIRLLNERLEPEKHSLFLNMNLVRDAHLALIIDNAIPRLRLPYIGNVQ